MKYLFPLLIFVTCCMECVAQTYIEPVFDRTDEPRLHINKIEVTKDTTFVYCTYTAEIGSWANISENTYLYNHKTHEKYSLLKCDGLPISPYKRDFTFGGVFQVLFYFPAIRDIGVFDFIENPNGKAFNIYGVDLSQHYDKPYTIADLDCFSNMSSTFDNSGNDTVAIQYKKQEVEALRFFYGIRSQYYFSSLLDLGIMYDKYGRYSDAIEIETLATKLYGNTDALYAQHLFFLALACSHAQDYEKSIIYYKEFIELYESLGISDNLYALALNLLTCVFQDIGEDEQALYYCQKCINACRGLGNSDKYINELYNATLCVSKDKDIDKARIQMVEDELLSLPDFVDRMSLDFVDVYDKMALLYTFQKNFTYAIEYCDKALVLLKEKGMENSERYAEILGLKCRYQSYSKLTLEAIITGEKSKQIFEALHVKSKNYAWLLSDLANLYRNIDDYEKAILMYEYASDIYKDCSEWLSLVEVLNSIGNCYRYIYDLDKAEIYIKKGLNVLSNNVLLEKDMENVVTDKQRQNSFATIREQILRIKSECYSELANVYSMKGELEMAIDVERESVKILQEMPNDQDLLTVRLSSLAILYKEKGYYEDAIKIEKQCLDFWKSREEKYNMALSQANIALFYFEKGDTFQAIKYAKESVSIFRNVGDKKDLTFPLGLLAFLYKGTAKYDNAEMCLSECLNILQTIIRQEIAEMTSEQKQRLCGKYRNLFFLYREIVNKAGMGGNKISKLYDYVLFSKSLLFDSEIFSKEALFQRLNVTWKDIQNKLSYEDIAVEFIAIQEEVTDDMTYYVYKALVIDKDCQYPKMITLIHDKEVEDGKEHVRMLWNPILNQYKDVKNIYFSPDGVMHLQSLENLYVDNVGFLSDKYNMYRLSSTKELVNPYNELRIENAVLYGGLTYSIGDVLDLTMVEGTQANLFRAIKERGGFDPLYNTSTEIYNISKVLEKNNIRAMLYMNEDGTEDSFKVFSGADINLIHLATHGLYVENEKVIQKKDENNFVFLQYLDNEKDPVYENTLLTHSFLVMAGGNKIVQRESAIEENNDGILTAQEISELDLSKVDLVVLSACETAKGEIVMDGVCGLSWGFKKAGAHTILMSLNKVDDEATRILMVEFYKKLMSGKSKLQSLKDAQKYLREYENGKYSEPEYWASFILLDGLD